MNVYKFTVRINGPNTQIQVTAATMIDARNIVESTHGKGSILTGPIKIS